MDRAKRFNDGKPMLSRVLEFGDVLDGLSQVMATGDEKYGRFNWRGGQDHTKVADSLLRHLSAWMGGEDNDPASGLPHVDHVVANAMLLAYNHRHHKDLDDRVTAGEGV